MMLVVDERTTKDTSITYSANVADNSHRALGMIEVIARIDDWMGKRGFYEQVVLALWLRLLGIS